MSTRKYLRICLAALGLVAAAFVACDRPRAAEGAVESPPTAARASVPAPTAAVPVPSPVEDGQNIFWANCIGCHGKNADGATPAGKAWHVPDLRSAGVRQASDAQLLQIVREGKGRMPAWGGLLSPIDLQHVLAYVRSLNRP